MKRILMSAILLFALSLLIVGATATDSSDDSKFLMIDHSNDFVSSGYIVYGAKNSRNIGSGESSKGGILMVNKAQAAYNSIDLSGYSTDDLVVFILNNRRCIGSMLHFSGSNPYEEAKEYFHGLAELESRKDAVDVLLRAYNVLKNVVPANDTERVEFRMRLAFLDIVLQSTYYSQHANLSNLSICAANAERTVTASAPLKAAYNFYYDHTADMTMTGGTSIPLYTARSDFSSSEKIVLAENLCNAHPNAILQGEATSAYNGYSYAWYNQSVQNNKCIFDILDVLEDPHVAEISASYWDNCSVGDIVVYYDNAGEPVHAGVVKSVSATSIILVSKWEEKCLFQHEAMDVPDRFYYDSSIGELSVYVYMLTPHVYTVTSNGGTGHTRTCNVCAKEIVEAHSLTIMGTCRVCGYSGPSVMP